MIRVQLKDICTKIGSGATPKGGSNSYGTEGISLIRSQNVLDYEFSYSGLAYINDEQAHKLKNVIVEEGDILLNITGDSVARACIVDSCALPARVNQHVSIIRCNKELVINTFLLYWLQMQKAYLLQLASGGATRNALTKLMIENLEIDLPDIKEQKRIVSLIDDVQDKIKLNKDINKNLQAQAQAIYSELFLNNPDPQWEMGVLSDIISVKYGKDHKKLEDGLYPVYGSGGVMRYVERPLYTGESVLIPRKGTLNNVMYVNGPFWSVDTMFYTEMLKPNIAKFVYHFMKSKDLASLNAGSAVPSMTTNILNAMQVRIPDDKTLLQFENSVAPMYETMKENDWQSATLAALRDALLPQFMSGELDISSLDI